jgi:hypothetical protein
VITNTSCFLRYSKSERDCIGVSDYEGNLKCLLAFLGDEISEIVFVRVYWDIGEEIKLFGWLPHAAATEFLVENWS